MRTKLYVLGAVLGAAPGLPSALMALTGAPSLETHPEARGDGRGAVSGNHAVVTPLPVDAGSDAGDAGAGTSPDRRPEVRDAGHRTRATEAPLHPCELITIVAVPCDATRATCEYTYWECPETAHPLRV